VSDLVLAGEGRIVTDADRSVFSVVPPTVLKSAVEAEAEAAAVAEATPTEPEVIERGKKAEEGDET
jgi:hypothetical protein